jgi:hypothetical protein
MCKIWKDETVTVVRENYVWIKHLQSLNETQKDLLLITSINMVNVIQ